MATDEFVPHKNAPGPARLEVEGADFSGTVHTEPMYIADRQAIINHVMAYAYLIDEGRWEDWYALFSDDFSFETTVPEIGTVIIKGKSLTTKARRREVDRPPTWKNECGCPALVHGARHIGRAR